MTLPTRYLHYTKNTLFFVIAIMTSTPKIGFHFIISLNKIHFATIAMIFAAKYFTM